MNPLDLHSFLRGKLEINCPKIELTPTVPSTSRTILQGSGAIALSDEGQFALMVYFPQTFALEEVFEHLEWEAGKVIPEDACYTVTAYDISGHVWKADNLIPDRNSGPNGSIITGRLLELKKQDDLTTATSKTRINYYFNRMIQVPFNTLIKEQEEVGATARKIKSSIRLARFTSCNIEFEVEEVEGHTSLRAVCEADDYQTVFISRIFEAFTFITASCASWSALEICHRGTCETRIRAVDTNISSSRILPPIKLQRVQVSNDVWDAFDCYLKHVLLNQQDYLHPISIEISSVIESGKASLDIQALTLAVSIEALLREEMADTHKDHENLKEDIAEAKRLINGSTKISADFKTRVPGLLGSMMNPRAKDILASLGSRGVIDEALIKIYGSLRNKSAHGGKGSGSGFQNYYNRISAVLVLFYQLVFLVIDYQGEYVDYSSYGYPVKRFGGRTATGAIFLCSSSDNHPSNISHVPQGDSVSLI